MTLLLLLPNVLAETPCYYVLLHALLTEPPSYYTVAVWPVVCAGVCPEAQLYIADCVLLQCVVHLEDCQRIACHPFGQHAPAMLL